MSTLLKYRLVPFEKALAFQVLEMDEEQRIYDAGFKSTKLNVRSVSNPELRENSINLRGYCDENDQAVVNIAFNSNQERDEYAQKVHQSLKEWQQNNGFLGVKPSKSIVQDDFTYTLEN